MNERIGATGLGLLGSSQKPEYKLGEYCSNENDSAECNECMAAWYSHYKKAMRKTWTSDAQSFLERQFRKFSKLRECERCVPVVFD